MKNDSLKALMERFPLEIRVVWNNYTRTSYNYLFKSMLGKEFAQLEYILEKLHQNGTTVSPRTAIKAAKMLDMCGSDCLDFIAEFSGKNADIVKVEINKFTNVEIVMDLRNKADEVLEQLIKLPLKTLDDIKAAKGYNNKLETLISQIKHKKVDDELMAENNKFITKISAVIKKRTTELEQLLKENE